MRTHPRWAAWLVGGVAMWACADPAAAQAPASGPAPEPAAAPLRLEHLDVDPANQRLIVHAQVCLRQGLLEVLLCRRDTKDYESILHTDAKPSDVHAALLAMGLAPGLPVRWDDRSGRSALLAPQGPLLRISLQWTDGQGQSHEAPAAQWLQPRGGQVAPAEWVFVGSQLLPNGAYLADLEGQIVSVSNFPASVIDVPFESTTVNADLDYQAKTAAIPPVGTAVDVVIVPLEGARQSPYARAMVELDEDGELAVEGRQTSAEGLGQWARSFVQAHPQAQVTIRSAGAALVADLYEARQQLRDGGVRDIKEEVLPAAPQRLLRTPLQVRNRLNGWQERFAQAPELVRDPGQAAQAELEQVARRRQELADLGSLLGTYAQRLDEMLRQYRAASQPGGPRP